MKLRPLADRVVLKQLQAEEKTKSGLFIATGAQEKPEMYEVIEVGPGGVVDGKEVVMTVEKGSKIAADLKAKNASIDALVNGNIEVNNQLDILSSAEINGAVSAERLSVAHGALLEGNMTIKHK